MYSPVRCIVSRLFTIQSIDIFSFRTQVFTHGKKSHGGNHRFDVHNTSSVTKLKVWSSYFIFVSFYELTCIVSYCVIPENITSFWSINHATSDLSAQLMWPLSPSIESRIVSWGSLLSVVSKPVGVQHVWWDLIRSKHVKLLWRSLTPVVKICVVFFSESTDWLLIIYTFWITSSRLWT